MFGLAYVVFFSVYLWLLVWVTRRGWRWGIEKRGWTGKKRYLGAAIGFLIVYLLVFWDWLPTVAVHQYYCATESGFWVYKTLDQWKAENPGRMEGLAVYKNAQQSQERFDDGLTDTYRLNDHFSWIIIKRDISTLLPVMRFEQQVKDVKKNEVLARYVDFSTGNSIMHTVGPPGPLKFWLHSEHCSGGGNNQDALRNFRNLFTGVEK